MNDNQDQGWNLFGFQLKKKVVPLPPSFVPVTQEDGGTELNVGSGAAYNSFAIDLDPSSVKNEGELVRKYREIALTSDIDIAVDEIVNESIVFDELDEPIDIDFSEDFVKKYSQQTTEIIKGEFEYIMKLLNFSQLGYDIFRSWYVDGKVAYHKIIDPKNAKNGITELRSIDVVKLKKVIEIQKDKDPRTGVDIVTGQSDYFIYSDNGFAGSDKTGLKIASDAIAYVTSGVIDKNTGMVLSYLHKTVRPLNQLRMMEDSEVIYRMSRAPQRRVFYIDTSGMARTKAEQYIKDVMARYKNKQTYDAATGTVIDSKKQPSILEDYWLPRSNSNKGTEITTLDGGGQLSPIENVAYYQNRLYQALNIPISRLQQGTSSFNLGRENEISRDEVKFSKFVTKLRSKFNSLFLDILKTQLLIKGISTPDDWEEIKNNIKFKYIESNFFSELKESEMHKERMSNVQITDPYVGKYFSKRYIQREILKLTDDEILAMEEENEQDEQLQAQMQQELNPNGEQQ